MEPLELQSLVEEVSLKEFGWTFGHVARFNSRLRTTAGRYLLRTHDIELSEKYFLKYGEQELIQVIKHELCHYHLHLQGRGYQHRDKDFRELLKRVNAPRFCKAMEIARKKESIKHKYQCMNCSQFYFRKRLINTAKYVCGKCKGKLEKV